MTTYEFVDSMGVPVWMSGFDALIDAIDILKNALQNNESPTIVDINRKLCVKYHTSAIAMDRLLRRAVDYAVIRKQTHGPLYYEVSAGNAFETVLVYLCAIFDTGGGVISDA